MSEFSEVIWLESIFYNDWDYKAESIDVTFWPGWLSASVVTNACASRLNDCGFLLKYVSLRSFVIVVKISFI